MRAVVAVIGKDTVGILAKICTICAEANANVMDARITTQSLLTGSQKPARKWDSRYTLCMRTFSTPCTEYKEIRHKWF